MKNFLFNYLDSILFFVALLLMGYATLSLYDYHVSSAVVAFLLSVSLSVSGTIFSLETN